jgi:hypothetical protein
LTRNAPNGPQHIERGEYRHNDMRPRVLPEKHITAPSSDPVARDDRRDKNGDQCEDQ